MTTHWSNYHPWWRIKNGAEPMKKEAREVLLRPLLLTENCSLSSFALWILSVFGYHSLNDHLCFQVRSSCPTQIFSPKKWITGCSPRALETRSVGNFSCLCSGTVLCSLITFQALNFQVYHPFYFNVSILSGLGDMWTKGAESVVFFSFKGVVLIQCKDSVVSLLLLLVAYSVICQWGVAPSR